MAFFDKYVETTACSRAEYWPTTPHSFLRQDAKFSLRMLQLFHRCAQQYYAII